MKIGQTRVGCEYPTFVIAEIGVNHDGSVDRALSLVHQAAESGANAVKLQVFKAEQLMHRSAAFADYQRSRTAASDPIAMLKQYELNSDAMHRIAEECRNLNIAVVATPFSPDDVATVAAFADAIKIASPDLVNRLLLSEAVAMKLPLIISTGASTLQEISDAATWLNASGADCALLHCVSSYPTPAAQAHLSWMNSLSGYGMPVGYSDHTTEPIAGALAVMAGACLIEKHLTYDTAAAGPDHSASFDGAQFKRYVESIRLAEQMRGAGSRHLLDVERDVRTVSRQSLVMRCDIHPGERFTRDHLTTQRPGTGISAVHFEELIGKAANCALRAGEMLSADAIQGWSDAA